MNRLSASSSDPDSALVHLFLEAQSGSPEAREALEARLRAFPSEQMHVRELGELWNVVGEMPAPPLSDAATVEGEKGRIPVRRWAAPMALAASVAAALFLSPLKSVIPGYGSHPVEERYVASGANRHFTLEDGSVVSLSADGVLRVAFAEDERIIRLDQGEAFFKVAHDKSRPFRVLTGSGEAMAVGTAFDVRVDPDDTLVIVTEGVVRITPQQGSISEDVRAGQQIRYDQRKMGMAFATDTAMATSWVAGTLRFDGAPLQEVIATVNRYSSRKITLLDPNLAGMQIFAILHTGDTDGILAIIREQGRLSPDAFRRAVDVEPPA